MLALAPNSTLPELGSSTAVVGFSSQGVSVPVSAGQQVYVWVYGFNFAQGSYDLTVGLG